MDQNVWTLPDASEIHAGSAASRDLDFADLTWSDPVALMPESIDLGDPTSVASLRSIDAIWPTLWDETRRSCLSRLRITLPPPQMPDVGVGLLPGGSVIVLDPCGVLCCDPAGAAALSASEARHVHRSLITHPHTPTLLHQGDGIILRSRMPDKLPCQAVTIVANGRRLPGRAACGGRALVQWCAGGATVWPLVPAPQCIALAAAVAGVSVTADHAPLTPVAWNAPNADARFQMLVPGIREYVTNLLSTELCDDLWHAIVAMCTDPDDSLASQLADAMALLPACFYPDASHRPGEPSHGWDLGTTLLRQAEGPRVMLGIEGTCDVQRAVEALRDVIEDPHAAMFAVSQSGASSSLVSLANDVVLSGVIRDGKRGRIGALIAPPHGPLEVYAMISRIAELVGVPVIASAPCWGYCHRVAPNGVEAGNAAWFGAGIGLDEIDALVDGIAHWG